MKLPEHRLAAILGVSRERVRKVLHRLAAERRLETLPRRGTFVPAPSTEAIKTVYEAHRVLEAGILLRLVGIVDEAILGRLDGHLAEEKAAADRGDRSQSVRLSGRFHMLLADALDNPQLSHFLRELLGRSAPMVSAFEPVSLSLCAVDEHAAIVAALRARDLDGALSLSREHFCHIEDRLAQGRSERTERDLADVLRPIKPSRPGRRRVRARSGPAA